jgi:hypothetical protein
MRKRTGIVAATLLASTLLAGGLHVSLAQDASSIVPDPSEYVVEPRTIENAVDLFMNGDYVPDESIIAGNLPSGEPAPDRSHLSPRGRARADDVRRRRLGFRGNEGWGAGVSPQRIESGRDRARSGRLATARPSSDRASLAG